MDGNFISTDIRYRDRINSRRRRSTSSSPLPTSRGGGNRSRSVGGRSVCGAIVEEEGGDVVVSGAVGGEVEGQIDEVFEDAQEGSGVGENVGGEGATAILEVPSTNGVNGGAEGGEGMAEVQDIVDAGGEVCAMNVMEEVETTIGDNVGEKSKEGGGGVVVEDVDVLGGEIGANVEVEGDGDVMGGEIGASGEAGGDVDVSASRGSGVGGGVPSGDSSRDSGSTVDPIPLIPRWRLRDILAHAEGECIYSVIEVLLLSVFRAGEVLRVLGQLLSLG